MINYQLIADSIKYYESKGFQRVEVPWTVTKPVSDITRPLGAGEFTIKEKDKVLVASGEQGFLYQYLKGFLPKGKYQAVTPCFRNEIFDNWHTKYFIKNELIDTENTTLQNLRNMVSSALDFFESIGLEREHLKIVDIDMLQFDIQYKDVELGSYGIRQCSFLRWIYGTGCSSRLGDVIDAFSNKRI